MPAFKSTLYPIVSLWELGPLLSPAWASCFSLEAKGWFFHCLACDIHLLFHVHVCCDTELFKYLLMVWLVRNQFTTDNTYIHTVLPMFVILLKPLARSNFSFLCFEDTSQIVRAARTGFAPAGGNMQPLVTPSCPTFYRANLLAHCCLLMSSFNLAWNWVQSMDFAQL